MWRIWALLAVACVPCCAHAETWQKCDLTVQVLDKKFRQIHAEVLAVKAKSQVECPAVADFIAFTPNTKDWQAELPRKQWPRIGQKWAVRYQYIDGHCKNDGDERSCRIKVYPKIK